MGYAASSPPPPPPPPPPYFEQITDSHHMLPPPIFSSMSPQIPISVGTAVNIRVGIDLGAGNPVSARRVSYIGLGQQGKNNVAVA